MWSVQQRQMMLVGVAALAYFFVAGLQIPATPAVWLSLAVVVTLILSTAITSSEHAAKILKKIVKKTRS